MRRHLAIRLLALTTALCPPTVALAQEAPIPPAKDAEYYRNWGVAMSNSFPAYLKGLTGKGIIVGVVDSGLYVRHPEFKGRVSFARRNFGDDQSPVNVNPPVVTDGPYPDGTSHGTHVSGIIAAARNGVGMQGIAYEATILPLRAITVSNARAERPLTNQALLYATRHGASVINGSYGPGIVGPTMEDENGNIVANPNYKVLDYSPIYSPTFLLRDDYRTMKRVADANAVMVFAAGNEYGSQPIASSTPYGNGSLPLITPETLANGTFRIVNVLDENFDINNPSTYKFLNPASAALKNLDFSDLQHSMIVVVAVDKYKNISSYSNRCGLAAAWCIAAPGGDFQDEPDASIYSTVPFSSAYPDEYRGMNGTSMAAPHVSGATALVRQAFPYMTASQAIETILTTATDLGSPEIYGQGLLNVGAAVNGPMEFRYKGIFDVDTEGYLSVWSNPISGIGDLTKRGAGALVLAGDNTYTGRTVVRGGVLEVDGRIVSGTTVTNGGVLAGSGTVGEVALTRGATIAPGSVQETGTATATLKVDGAFLQGDGSIYAAGLSGATSDRIATTGVAVIGADTTLSLARESSDSLTVGAHYTLLTAKKGVLGTYGSVSAEFLANRPFVEVAVAYDAGTVSADLNRTDVAFADVATTANTRAVAAAADVLGAGSTVYNRVAFLTAADANGAFAKLSGEIHPSAQSVLMTESHFVRDAATDRLRSALSGIGVSDTSVVTLGTDSPAAVPVTPDRLAVWGRGYGAWGNLDSNGNAAQVDTSTGGFLAGMDAPLGDVWRLGALAGYSRTSFSADAVTSSGSSDSYHAGLYGGAQWSQIGVRSGVAYSWNSLSTSRNVSFPEFGETLKADYDAGTFQVFGDLGYRIDTKVAAFEPFVNLAYVTVNADSFQESGGTAALSGADASSNNGFTTLGLRAATSFGVGTLTATARAELGWLHAYGDVTPEASLAFGSGTPFSVAGTPIARDAATLAAGLDLKLAPSATLGLSYQGQFASDAMENGLNGRLSIRF